ncbi:hypothetical protein PM082_004501 [Marasmius tenuissimus]|nr:hypothetical protein PM082_004501 [Marasmius tenuissimus]
MTLSEPIEQTLQPYLSVQSVIIRPLATLSLMFLVYGTYVMIFGLSLNAVFRRGDSLASRLYINGVISLFALITITNSTIVWYTTHDALVFYNTIRTKNYVALLEFLDHLSTLRLAQFYLFDIASVATGAITEYLLVHRCYIIWGSRKAVFYTLVIPMMIGNALNLADVVVSGVAFQHRHYGLYQVSMKVNYLFVVIGSVYSLLLSLATGGRIWWISREARLLMGRNVRTRYKVIVATIFETGILYSGSQAICAVLTWFANPDGKGTSPLIYIMQIFASQMAKRKDSFTGSNVAERDSQLKSSIDSPLGVLQRLSRQQVVAPIAIGFQPVNYRFAIFEAHIWWSRLNSTSSSLRATDFGSRSRR